MLIEIDTSSGFCYGVINAIKEAEKHLSQAVPLYCLGEIVHNNAEVNRLEKAGLITISHSDMGNPGIKKMLIRAHGEPPSTYIKAKNEGIEIVDATCPVVLKLQQKIKDNYQKQKNNHGQIIIFGQKGHAEVNGLVGQTDGNAIVVEKTEDLENIDFSRPLVVFSQTTKNIEQFNNLVGEIKKKAKSSIEVFDTICRQVSGRMPKLKVFAQNHEVIVFVGGKNSSNAKVLFQMMQEVNPKSYFVSNARELTKEWFQNIQKVGVCGATSTPMWIMEEVADAIRKIASENESL